VPGGGSGSNTNCSIIITLSGSLEEIQTGKTRTTWSGLIDGIQLTYAVTVREVVTFPIKRTSLNLNVCRRVELLGLSKVEPTIRQGSESTLEYPAQVQTVVESIVRVVNSFPRSFGDKYSIFLFLLFLLFNRK